MKIKSLFASLLAATLLVGVVACEKDPKPGKEAAVPGSQKISDLVETEIAGTKLNTGVDLAGQILDTKTKKPIAGVAVTDGYTYVKTDANGVYQMKRNAKSRRVYYSTPAEYAVSLDAKNHMPSFYVSQMLVAGKKYRVDFGLTPLPAVENNFSLVMIGDPQCQVAGQVGRYKKETIEDIKAYVKADKYPNAYAITLGDVTFDSKDTYPLMKASMSNVSIDGRYLPFFQCIGNHDHDSTVLPGSTSEESDYIATERYFQNFGPTDYSFNRGKAHIIVMDDILCTTKSTNSSPNGATWGYNAGFTDTQFEWFKQDLATVENKADKIVFLCMHIPMRAGAASGGASFNTSRHYAEVLSALAQFHEAHVLIGHTHYPQNYIHNGYKAQGGQPIYEHIHQAACGAWWSSNSCVTGGPNGYTVYNVNGNSVADWLNKGTARDEKYQVRAYDGNQIYTGTKQYKYSWYNQSVQNAGIKAKVNAVFQNAFVAEIWDDDDTNWKVELWQNGSKVGDFKRVANGGSCNLAIVSYYFNECGKSTDTWTSATASHYWYYVPASKTPASEKNWEIRATQTIPSSGKTKTYTVNRLTTDYKEF